MAPKFEKRRVALLIESATSWGAGILEGIASYARNAEWACVWEPRGKAEKLALPTNDAIDGVIARVTHQGLADQIREREIPAVNVSWYRFGGPSIPRCTTDESLAGKVAAEHFLERGYKRFAYCGAQERGDYVDRFGMAFRQFLAGNGFECEWFGGGEPGADAAANPPHVTTTSAFRTWLQELPKPCGLLAFHSTLGRRIIDTCTEMRIDVPNDIAVLGGEHDTLSVRFSSPPQSSLDLSTRAIGRGAAALLDEVMRTGQPASKTVLVPPGGVYQRQSTNAVAVDDPEVAAAARFVFQNATSGIKVSDVLKAVAVSRRTLEQGFRRHFGRTPAEEIRRVKVYAAAEVLRGTDIPIAHVASDAGFESSEVLIRAFSRQFGVTPGEYRKRFQ